MIVTCPNCSTSFNLPAANAKENAKLRCSVCKHTFVMPNQAPINLNLNFGSKKTAPGKKSSKGKKFLIFLMIVLCVGAVAGYMNMDRMPPYIQKYFKTPAGIEEQSTEDLIKSIVLRDVRHYNFNNEKVGAIAVIEGKVVNGFTTPRELIRVEATLYSKDGRALVAKQQLVGTTVSLFQLQVLGEGELEKALSNKIDILTNNTNVLPGAEVPFLVVFYNPPDTAVEFGIKVVDAKKPPVETP